VPDAPLAIVNFVAVVQRRHGEPWILDLLITVRAGDSPLAFLEGRMKLVGLFVAGFAAGWVVRSAVDSSHDLAVGLVATAYGAYDRTKRLIAVEREHMEDLFAEGKARYEAKRARHGSARRDASGPRVAEVPRVRAERAA
jgi:hypothetical protein